MKQNRKADFTLHEKHEITMKVTKPYLLVDDYSVRRDDDNEKR